MNQNFIGPKANGRHSTSDLCAVSHLTFGDGRYPLYCIGNDVFSGGVIVGDFDPVFASGVEAESTEGAKQLAVFLRQLLIQSQAGLAVSVTDDDQRICGTPNIAAVGQANFVPAAGRQVRSISGGFLAFAGVHVVQIAASDVWRRVG